MLIVRKGTERKRLSMISKQHKLDGVMQASSFFKVLGP